MQRIMIVSDTHRRHGNLAEAIYNEGHLDMLIHLGDVEGEEEVIKSIAGCETIFIAGNNDFFSPLDREKEIELGGKKIFRGFLPLPCALTGGICGVILSG